MIAIRRRGLNNRKVEAFDNLAVSTNAQIFITRITAYFD